MRIVVRLGVALALGMLLLGAVFWWAAEWDGVAVVTTHAPDGSARRTHIWYVKKDDALWLEAGAPEHPWYLDVQRDPRVTLEADDLSGEYVVSTVPGADAAAHVRALMRAKYGLRDRVILLVVDASRTTALLARKADPGASPPATSPPSPATSPPGPAR